MADGLLPCSLEAGHDLPWLGGWLETAAIIVEPDLGVESSQEFAFHHRTGQLIEPGGIGQQVEVGQHGIGLTTQLLVGVG
ncbi:hypothetical protein [[Pseudopropionibacterium] massiliense]|uniref:hypothetical protein n=1 Tax=[Pseudopropionibacterium] massiliense TaxID=2220000 RepID=UPI0010309400|nr:hypothetical protein [[Pseudopropionibacterium] massiliense]